MLDCDLDEAYTPGGITWDEAAAFPFLADFECSVCGEIGCGCVHEVKPLAPVTRRLSEHENRRVRLDNEKHVRDLPPLPWWKECAMVNVDALRASIAGDVFATRVVARLCAVEAERWKDAA